MKKFDVMTLPVSSMETVAHGAERRATLEGRSETADEEDVRALDRAAIRARHAALAREEREARSAALREVSARFRERTRAIRMECAAIGHEFELVGGDPFVQPRNVVTGARGTKCRTCGEPGWEF